MTSENKHKRIIPNISVFVIQAGYFGNCGFILDLSVTKICRSLSPLTVNILLKQSMALKTPEKSMQVLVRKQDKH